MMSSETGPLDALFTPGGSLTIVALESERGAKWADEFLTEQAHVGRIFCLDSAFADRVRQDMEADGLSVGVAGIAVNTSYAGGGVPGWERITV